MVLFDLSFLELDMLADFWVVFLERQLLGGVSRIFFGRVIGAGSRRADKLDQNRVGLSHGLRLSKQIAISSAT